jgi:hypothetical protein
VPFIGRRCVMAAMAGCGLPGFATPVGEVTVFFGAWKVFLPVTAGTLGRADHRRVYARAVRNFARLPENSPKPVRECLAQTAYALCSRACYCSVSAEIAHGKDQLTQKWDGESIFGEANVAISDVEIWNPKPN